VFFFIFDFLVFISPKQISHDYRKPPATLDAAVNNTQGRLVF